jgi:hypothetical protein
MAAGAILPPMFFERPPCESIRSERGIFRNTRKQHQRCQRNSTAGVICRPPAIKSLPKEI